MAKMEGKHLALIALILVLVWQGGNGGTTTSSTSTTTIPGGCAIDPQFQLTEVDKWGASAAVGANHTYKINQGGSATATGQPVTVPLGSTIDVLWFNGNASYNNELGSFTVNQCGINQFEHLEAVRNTTMTVQCFNEEGNLIGGAVTGANENETVGTGEAVSLDCEIRGVAEQGFTHGGVMVLETPRDSYVEAKTVLSGNVIGSTVSVPSYYSTDNGNTSKATKAYRINPVIGVGVRNFVLSFEAEATVNPGTENITMNLFADDCYEDQEANIFACANEDEDNAMTGYFVGSETIVLD